MSTTYQRGLSESLFGSKWSSWGSNSIFPETLRRGWHSGSEVRHGDGLTKPRARKSRRDSSRKPIPLGSDRLPRAFRLGTPFGAQFGVRCQCGRRRHPRDLVGLHEESPAKRRGYPRLVEAGVVECRSSKHPGEFSTSSEGRVFRPRAREARATCSGGDTRASAN